MEHDRIKSLVEAIAARTRADDQRIAARLQLGCWPGGGTDRSEPAAREWLRRWRPATAAVPRPVCLCAQGRCAICN